MALNINRCQTCLCSNRVLYPIKNMETIVEEINLLEIQQLVGGVCWECRSTMLQFWKFKAKAKLAQHTLKTNNEVSKWKSLSTLDFSELMTVNFHYYDDCDPLTNHTSDNEWGTLVVKTEQDINIKNELKSVETEPMLNVFADYIRTDIDDSDNNSSVPNKISRISNDCNLVNQIKKGDAETRDLITSIELTEEEMLRKRDERRNHSKYKRSFHRCESCIITFSNAIKYFKHLERRHKGKGDYTCDICERRFVLETTANAHRSTHYSLHSCKVCKFEDQELWVTWEHCRSKHNVDSLKELQSKPCESIFKTCKDLEVHVEEKNSHYQKCNECGDTFKAKNTLQKHIRRVHDGHRIFKCDLCNKTFSTKTRLESHIITHNRELAQKLSYCATCDVQYKNIYVYRSHLKNNANHSKVHQCTECNRNFASKSYLKSHYNFYHLRKSKFRCEHCDKIFISRWRLTHHVQLYHDVVRPKNYSCDVCHKKFHTKATLKSHVLTHSEDRTFMCEDCGDTFKQRAALYTHTRLVHKRMKRNT